MAKIKSNIELIYDSRSQKQGIIQLEINSWNFDASNKRYVAIVEDFVINQIQTDISNQDLTMSTVIENRKTLISSIKKHYSKEQIDGLFALLQNPIQLTESYTDEMDNLISMALLFKTQQEPIYNSVSNNWQITNY